jgi:hypothetical protein
MKEDVLKTCLDYILRLLELNEIRRMKDEAIKNQSFNLACEIRDKELELLKILPTYDDLKAARDLLNNEQAVQVSDTSNKK